eukprot:scaffold499_cov335-Pavlova_lutheri.AAC.5
MHPEFQIHPTPGWAMANEGVRPAVAVQKGPHWANQWNPLVCNASPETVGMRVKRGGEVRGSGRNPERTGGLLLPHTSCSQVDLDLEGGAVSQAPPRL